MNPQLLSTDRVASMLGLSTSYLNKLRLTGEGPTFIKAGRRVLYRPEDIAKWIEANRRSSTSQEY